MERDRELQQPAFSQEAVVRFYRSLGFFQGGSFSECADSMLKRFEDDHGHPLNPQKPWDDVYLLSYDQVNVWADDPECDVGAGNEVYQDVLAGWSRISKGLFIPEEVKETWHGEEGPIKVTFGWHGKQHTIQPKWDHDWFDLDVLGAINQLIASTGKQFVCASDVNFAIVFLLDDEGKRRLAEVRKFPFLEWAR